MEALFDINKFNDDMYNDVIKVFNKYDYTISDAIVTLVSGLFNVDKEELFLHNTRECYTIPRWMCWCAFSQFTNQSYNTIARSFARDGETYTAPAIGRGIWNIRRLIDTDPIIKSKWGIIEKFLKANKEAVAEEKITIIVPVGFKEKIEIKEARI